MVLWSLCLGFGYIRGVREGCSGFTGMPHPRRNPLFRNDGISCERGTIFTHLNQPCTWYGVVRKDEPAPGVDEELLLINTGK